jgi:protein TonB
MASPEELTPLLPETLPEDFGDWDSEASPAPSLPVNADEWEAWAAAHPFSDTSKPLGQSLDRDAEASSADRPRVAGSASSAPEFAKQEVVFSYEDSEASPKAKPVNSREEWEAWIESHSSSETPKPFGQSAERKAILSPVREAGLSIREAGLSIREAGLSIREAGLSISDGPRASGSASSAPVLVKEQELTGNLAVASPSRTSQGPAASRTTNEVSMVQASPNAATADGTRNLPKPTAALKREADETLFQWYSSKDIEVKAEQATAQQKTAKNKWMIVAAVSASSILLLLMIPLFYLGSKSVAKPSVQTLPVATDSQQVAQTPNPPDSEPLAQDKPLPTAQNQVAKESQPASQQVEASPPKAPTKQQAKVMDDQLTAPALIPQGNEMQSAEDAPPPVSLDAAGADGLGQSGANVSVFNGHALPVVKVVPSKPVVVSSGVASGMLILKTPPIYPAIAKAAHVSGTVELHATIAKNGTIKNLRVVKGPIILQQAAVDAVRNWRYKPYRLNNEPVEVETTIDMVFSLTGFVGFGAWTGPQK